MYVYVFHRFLLFFSALLCFRCFCFASFFLEYNANANQTPHDLLPKLFGPLRERYQSRPGGYTRVLHVEPKKDDRARSAILELVDGPKDMRFAITARTLMRQRAQGFETLDETTAMNARKVTRYRKNGIEELEDAIRRLQLRGEGEEEEEGQGNGKKGEGKGKEKKEVEGVKA